MANLTTEGLPKCLSERLLKACNDGALEGCSIIITEMLSFTDRTFDYRYTIPSKLRSRISSSPWATSSTTQPDWGRRWPATSWRRSPGSLSIPSRKRKQRSTHALNRSPATGRQSEILSGWGRCVRSRCLPSEDLKSDWGMESMRLRVYYSCRYVKDSSGWGP